MKYNCEVIKDIIPLEIDELASDASKEMIKEHLDECEFCKGYYEGMIKKTDLNMEEFLSSEQEGVKEITAEKSVEEATNIKEIVKKERIDYKPIVDYSRRVKKKRQKSKLQIILGAIALPIIAILLFIALLDVSIAPKLGYRTVDQDKYGQFEGNFEKENHRSSHLLIFPERITEGMEIDDYLYYGNNEFGLDNEYQIYLDLIVSDEQMEMEKVRLSQISMSYKSEIQMAIRDDELFQYPAYITVYNDDHTYEYALINEEENRIIYIFHRFVPLDKNTVKEEYLPKTMNQENIGEKLVGFSIYKFGNSKDGWYLPKIDE